VNTLRPYLSGLTTSSGSFLVVIAVDCEGRALSDIELSAGLHPRAGGATLPLDPVYALSDRRSGFVGIGFFADLPPGTVQLTATYHGEFYSSGQVEIVSDGSTLIALGPSAR